MVRRDRLTSRVVRIVGPIGASAETAGIHTKKIKRGFDIVGVSSWIEGTVMDWGRVADGRTLGEGVEVFASLYRIRHDHADVFTIYLWLCDAEPFGADR